jgi:hypothetical protein
MSTKLNFPRRRSSPLRRPLVGLFLHALVSVIAVVAIGASLANGTWTPSVIGFALVTLLEGVWWYYEVWR